MNKTKDQSSWVLAHDLHWENKMYKRKRSIPAGLVGDTNMAAVPLFRDTKMAAMTSRENTLDATEFAYVASAYAFAASENQA